MATEYRELNAVIKAIWSVKISPDAEIFNALKRAIEEEVKNIEPADVVEVVRCKDCRFFFAGYNEKCCINHKGVAATDENGFCHHAERMAEE